MKNNIPLSIIEDLQKIEGFDQQAFVLAHTLKPITSVRLHPTKNAGIYSDMETVPWCEKGKYLINRPIFTLDPAFHAGAYYVQEASSMFLAHVLKTILKDKTGLRVLDLCAAPGGKSTLIAELLDTDSLLIANEVIRSRASILEENMTRWGFMNTFVTCNDPRSFSKLEGYFDIIIVDAPCSGSGLFRKDAKALVDWSESNVQLCSERQLRILTDIMPALKTNGILIYSTCSYSVQENEHILDWLSTTFTLKTIPLPIPLEVEWGIVPTYSPINEMCGYRFSPEKVKGEGFFIAALQKTSISGFMRVPRFKTEYSNKILKQASYLLQDIEFVCINTDGENFSALHPTHVQDYQVLQKHLYFRKVGLAIGMPTLKEWLPAHDVALSINVSSNLPFIELNKQDSLHFLKRDDLVISGTVKGWHLIKYMSLNLGWVKILGNRINNYFPKQWRIRMDINEKNIENPND